METLKFSEAHYPVEAFFNRLLRTDKLAEAMKNFANGQGYNPENLTCFFPVDLAEDDGMPPESHNKIEFWTYSENEEVVIGFDEFTKYLGLAVSLAEGKSPERKSELRVLEGRVSEKLRELDVEYRAYQSKNDEFS